MDVIAIFLPHAHCWYLIPEAKLRNKKGEPSSSVTLNPDDPNSKFYSYKENWEVIDQSMHEVGDAPTEEDVTNEKSSGLAEPAATGVPAGPAARGVPASSVAKGLTYKDFSEIAAENLVEPREVPVKQETPGERLPDDAESTAAGHEEKAK